MLFLAKSVWLHPRLHMCCCFVFVFLTPAVVDRKSTSCPSEVASLSISNRQTELAPVVFALCFFSPSGGEPVVMFPHRYLPCPPSSLPPLEVKKKQSKAQHQTPVSFPLPRLKKLFFPRFSCFLFATARLASPQKRLSFKHRCETPSLSRRLRVGR